MSADRNGKRLDNNRLWASVAAPGLVLAVLLLVVPGARAQDDPAQRRQEFYDNLKILGDVYERVINNYVDEVDPHEVMKAAVEGMLSDLDEHSNYLPPVNYEDLMTSTEGEFGGLGISIQVRDHYPTVVSPIEGTPAYYMGVQGGDQIIAIEGESTRDFSSSDAVKRLRGTATADEIHGRQIVWNATTEPSELIVGSSDRPFARWPAVAVDSDTQPIQQAAAG